MPSAYTDTNTERSACWKASHVRFPSFQTKALGVCVDVARVGGASGKSQLHFITMRMWLGEEGGPMKNMAGCVMATADTSGVSVEAHETPAPVSPLLKP